jgi:Flp pilus assembly protein TadB
MGRRRFNDSPISAKKDELARQEEELRRQMEELQRQIEEAPRLAEAEQERQRQERIARATTRRSPFDSPDILHDSRHGEDLFSDRPSRPRRAHRRQARRRLIVLCLSILVLVTAVVLLAMQMFNHL